MTEEEIQRRIDEIDARQLRRNAYFSIVRHDEREDHDSDLLIEANYEGLTLYGVELLKAADKINKDRSNSVYLPTDTQWISGDVMLSEIRFTEKPEEAEGSSVMNQTNKPSVGGTFVLVGCFGIAALVITAIIVGFYTIFKWF